MTEEETKTLEIDMDKECSQCGEKGVGEAGLCLKCIADKLKNEKETSIELIKMDFTDEEKIDFGRKISELVRKLKSIESQKQSAAADFKASEKQTNLEIDELVRKIDDGFEMRRENCEVSYNDLRKEVDFLLDIDGEIVVVKTRKMTPNEIQQCLPGMG